MTQSQLSDEDRRLYPARNFAQHTAQGTTPGVANTEFQIIHNLKRGPAQVINGQLRPGVEFVYYLDGPGTLYASNIALWDENTIRLKCTDASRNYTIYVR